MSRYGKVAVHVWRDRKFRALSALRPSGQALWLHLLTSPVSTMLPGVLCIGRAALAEELRWSDDDLRHAFAELELHEMATADWEARLVYLVNAPRHNPPLNPNVVTGWGEWWRNVPDCALKERVWTDLRRLCDGRGPTYLEAFLKACPPPSAAPSGNHPSNDSGNDSGNASGNDSGSDYRIQEQVQEQDQVQEQEGKREGGRGRRRSAATASRSPGGGPVGASLVAAALTTRPGVDPDLVAWLLNTYPDVRRPAEFVAAAAEAYPRLDLLATARAARAWEAARPDRAKRDHARFLNRWWAEEHARLPPPSAPRLPDQWWVLLPPDDLSAFQARRQELDPSLDASAPMSVAGTGPNAPAVSALVEEYRGRAAARLRNGAAA